jgi:acid stress-induced BolA-like protein IbaG/YrbA
LLPVTVATAESLSKLRIIKTYLRPPIAQNRLDALSMSSIEAEEARKLSVDNMID